MRNKSVWPPPVYEGTFADGSVLRMSFHQARGKQIDFARGRRLVALVGQTESGSRVIVSGVVHLGSEQLIDPMTDTPAKVKRVKCCPNCGHAL